MATTIIMPKLGLTMTEGTIEKWLKKEGERVEKGEPLLKILTEKINFQYESPASGILRKVLYKEGAVVPVTTPIAIIAEEGEALPEIEVTQAQPVSEAPATAAARKESKEPQKRILASPAAKKIAEEKGIDLSVLMGSGPGGRIVLADVVNLAGKAVSREAELSGRKSSGKFIPLKGIRKVIAQRMTESFRDVPHFYLSVEADMSAVRDLREKIKDQIERHAKVKLTVTDILVKIVASALKSNPMMNSRVEGDQIHLLDEVNVGVAIALEEGLIVPVVRNADHKSLTEITSDIKNLIRRAKRGKLALEDVTGGTFTLSNMGMLGIDMMSPIINPPECSILGVGRTIEKPVVERGEIKVKPMAWLTLSSDHRIVDGAAASFFLNRIREIIENPTFLLV